MSQKTKDNIRTWSSVIAVVASLITAGYSAGVQAQRVNTLAAQQAEMKQSQDKLKDEILVELRYLRNRIDAMNAR